MAINCSGYRDLNRGRAFGFGPFFVLNPGGCELEPEQLFWFDCPDPARIPAKSASFFCADLFNESNSLADNLFFIYKRCAIVLAITA